MNGRTIAGIVLTLLLVGGAIAIGVAAYNAGVTQGLVNSGHVVVAPGYPEGPFVGGYGSDRGGFGFFGFLGTVFFIFLVIALLRAVIGGGRGGWGRSWGGPGWGGRGGPYGHGPWSDRAREIHDELHRQVGKTDQDPNDQPRG